MGYTDEYFSLRKVFKELQNSSGTDSEIHHNGVSILKRVFTSQSNTLLPGNTNYRCAQHQQEYESTKFSNEIGTFHKKVNVDDVNIEENIKYDIYILMPSDPDEEVKDVTILLHGFNEKSWDKYLPWAQHICESTGNAVILFPIAFHMQRAPTEWSEKRSMYKLSEHRKKQFPNIVNSTLSNVAISMRLHARPQRFIWSGLQTYYDVLQFVEEIKSGKYEKIRSDCSFSFFGFSIGGLLSQIIKLSNHNNYFNNSKVILFCSGTVFNRMSPVSKFIIDSEANIALYSYLIEHFDRFMERDPMLKHFIQEHEEGRVFHSLLDFHKNLSYREKLLKKVEKDIYAITLSKDRIIPPFEVVNTLQGAYRDINIRIDEIDFPYKYRHENPFPVNSRNQAIVDEEFIKVFHRISQFLIG